MLNNVQKNSPFKKFRFYFVSLQFFHFILLISIRFASDFFLVKQFLVLLRFTWIFSLLFAYFTFVLASDFAVSLRCETSKIMPFFCFQAKQNFRFNFNFRFRSENEGAPYTDKKENQTFLIYREIQSGAVAKSYMGKVFIIYEEMRKYFPIYEEAVSHI